MATMLKLFLLTIIVGVTRANFTYVIVAPTEVRPGMDFDMSAHIINATGDVHITAYLNDSWQTTVGQSTVVLNQGQTEGITLKIPKNLKSGTYSLVVTGSGGLNFTGYGSIKYQAKSMSTLIQTDKALYKPGQTVHFRVFSVYPNMKVFTGQYNIYIYDPHGNKIKQWINVTDTSGVFTNFLEMSSQPLLGDWNIKVQTDNSWVEKTFSIAEYVLPKFEVTVELPSYTVTSDNDITAAVKAKYTYGKPVKGTVQLEAKLEDYHAGWNYKREVPIVNKTFNIDGESKVTISLVELKQFISALEHRKIRVVANVTEGLTGITLTGSSKVEIYQYATKLSFSPSDPNTFKPGLKYIAYLQVLQQDGRPVQHSTKRVVINTSVKSEIKSEGTTTTRSYYYYPQYVSSDLPEKKFTVPDTGVVPIEILIPANASSVTIEAHYDSVHAYKTIERSETLTNNYLQLLLVSKHVVAGKNATFSVRSTQPVNELVYQVMSRGTIAATGSIDGNNQENFNFDIPVTSKMAPDPRIVVYYIEGEGHEIIPDSISFHVDGAFENQVSISMGKTSAQPGESVNIQVTADPQSLVNLLAVDQSVLLLKSGNDITQSQVIEELKSYDSKAPVPKPQTYFPSGGGIPIPTPYPVIPVRSRRMPYLGLWLPTYYGGNDTYELFKNAGVLVITDAYMFWKPLPVYHPFPLPGMMPGGHSGGPVTGGPIIVPGTGTATGTQNLKEVEQICSDFPETWLWINKTIRVFRPFFVSLNLPYSVTRGEQVALQAIVFNYLTQDADAVVSLPQSHEYQNVIIDSNGHEQTGSKDIMQTVQVKAGGAQSVFFPIVPTTMGKIDFTVSARSTLAADAVKKQILVEPEGTPKEFNIPILVQLNSVNTFTKQAQITLPQNVVAGSVRTRVTAIGDFMGPSIHGLESLLQMPHGCGEEYGYQRELTYQHTDGSFSAFGDRDSSGSMWLTAFVVKTFHQAKPYIFIDEEVLRRGINWMVGQQATDGHFPEPSPVHYINTGGSGKGTALTAFVLIALLENNDLTGGIHPRTRQAISKAVKYLESNTPPDVYSLAIVTYALQLAGSPTADSFFATLNSHAIVKDGFKYWHRQVNTSQSSQTWRLPYNAKAIDIETTSYAFMIYQKRNDFSGGVNVMKWIVSQRNPNGGFSSTQDTVIALQSLSMMSMLSSKDNNVEITVSGNGLNHRFSIDEKNFLMLQSVELPSVPNSVQVDASGHGRAFVQISVFFNVDADIEEPKFNLTWKILEEDINSITLQTCASWLSLDTSGMAIQEVGLPSGFEVDLDTISEMKILKRIETPNKKVVLYFTQIGSSPVCMTFNLMRTGLVAKSQPVPIRVYDYYEPSNQKTVFYESAVLKNSTICGVCNDCENCSVRKLTGKDSRRKKGGEGQREGGDMFSP